MIDLNEFDINTIWELNKKKMYQDLNLEITEHEIELFRIIFMIGFHAAFETQGRMNELEGHQNREEAASHLLKTLNNDRDNLKN